MSTEQRACVHKFWMKPGIASPVCAICGEHAKPGKAYPLNEDDITSPSHYIAGRTYEPRLVIIDWELGFYLGNTVKYISRAGRKNIEKNGLGRLYDLRKAAQYLAWEIEIEEQRTNQQETPK